MNAPAANPAEPGEKFTLVGDREVTVLSVAGDNADYVWNNGPIRENPDNKKKERLRFTVKRSIFENPEFAVRA